VAAVHRMTAGLQAAVLVLLLSTALAAGCSSSSEPDPKKGEPLPTSAAAAPTPTSAAVPTPTLAAAPTPTFAPGLQAAGGVAYAVGIPTDPAVTKGPSETRANGTSISRWHFELSPGGPACTIVASEQPAYAGDFPAAILQTFEVLAERTDKIVTNEQVPPPPGAVGAVRQESTFLVKLAGGTSVQARLYQRQLLTAGKTLVSLTVAAPEDALARCRAKDVAASLQLTGHEAARSARSTPGGPVS